MSAGTDATDPTQWCTAGTSATAPGATARITAVVFFPGTSNIGGLQAMRVDNAALRGVGAGCGGD